ncbi:NADH:ubiquinone reductase (Na(+)-transporting) subunit F [Allosediminivita pacifica]|uniref:Na(+)-translocating NADH-quinone reductase subunit F n=1 Tax=Allosediminivita pacifica TaxID=1267769 RepID=A0A2T6ANK8_9RHOB|nr:NADH:ubiquinone reductase (Na(+)-transporting) subunit F [Allosediminivita pacifica]PTX45395.1 Na+-transporting NADH:ubiquinone oxidoreductase subunit F [Allosediminivita pacifica]GGB20959.1 Na(+)-translocating NADH-quinone reductase subunit F [Allosediminivita pacifica]
MTEIILGTLVVTLLVLALAVGLLQARKRLVPSGAIDITVNGGTHITAERGSRLLQVLHGNDIRIPAACGGSGTCGLCRVHVTGEGAGEPQATEKGVLSARERRDHMRLACQTSLRGDCAVTVPDDILSSGGGFICTVASTRMMAPLIREIVLDLPEGQPFDYLAGDFMQITAPPYKVDFGKLDLPEAFRETWEIAGWTELSSACDAPVTRAYSVANRAEDVNRAVFNIRLAVPPAGMEHEVPPGKVSSWLFSLKEGDKVEASGPFGEFHAQPTEAEMVFIGGGVGMAPLRALIHEQLGRGSTRRLRYFYGARSVADLFYVEEFDRLSEANPNFTWTPALSDPAPGDRWTGATGFIHEALRREMAKHPAPEDCEYYLCGPPVMISAVLATLERLGVEPENIFYDDFGG